MNISLQDFKTITPTPALHKSGIHAIGRAHLIMSKFYCDKMTMRSLCSRECGSCALFLQRAAQIDPSPTSNPYAIFTWRVKNEFAKRADEAAKTHKVITKKNALGEKVETDPFDNLMEAFGG
jgi:hypothetical protein